MRINLRGVIWICALALLSGAAFPRDLESDLHAYLTECHGRGLFNGAALIARGDRVILKHGYGFADLENKILNTPRTVFRIGSITKQFTVVMCLQLVDEGRLRRDGFLSEYLPDYRRDTGSRVTIDHLLRHTSGIPTYARDREFWNREVGKIFTRDEMIRRFHSGDLEFEPGSRYKYNNSAYYLLGVVIERVTGTSYADNLRVRILEPLGLTRTGVDGPESRMVPRAVGYVRSESEFQASAGIHMPNLFGCGDMVSTVEDLHVWDLAMGTDRLLSADMRRLMFTPYGNRYQGHAYGWDYRRMRLRKAHRNISYACFNGGLPGFLTDGVRVEDGEYIIVLFSNMGSFELGAITHALIHILYGEEGRFPEPTGIRHPISSMRSTS